eukprot:TRINITY_DN7577_c0_g2_i4.p1 TRINITY_DN7577_c0_g2~~TRINITY_DN7577_c0_g2_i4.p1  ORF type:complete len:237 (-),score=16.68 TRINITY_DN7577_c0_g2_i4:63-773(-)
MNAVKRQSVQNHFYGERPQVPRRYKFCRFVTVQCRQYSYDQDAYSKEIFHPDFDPMKENSRQYRRALFTHERWASHRSTTRYLRHLQGIFRSRIVYGLLKPVAAVTFVAALFCTYFTLVEGNYLPEALSVPFNIRSDPFSLSSFALALLLVFRTDASYGRWEEAHRCWELISTFSRTLLRESCTMLRKNKGVQQRIGDWICAYAHCIVAELRQGVDLEYQLEDRLNREEIQFLNGG